MKTSLPIPIIATSAVLLAACASTPTYTFDAAGGQGTLVEYEQGVPVLYSQGKNSIVAVKPADRTFSTNNDLAFQIVVTNAGVQPFDVAPEDVVIHFMRSGEMTSYGALGFDDYVKLKEEDKTGAGVYALAMLGTIAGAGFSGYGSGLGSSSLVSSGDSITNDASGLVNLAESKNKGISDQVSAAEEVYLHRTTVNPGQTQSGMVYFANFDGSDDNTVNVEVALPGDTHRVTFTLAKEQ